jgi:hypothetical protein
MDTIKGFFEFDISEKYGLDLRSVFIPAKIKSIVDDLFGWDRAIEETVKVACFYASKLHDQGFVKLDTVTHKNENIISKLIISSTFGNARPVMVTDRRWDHLAKTGHKIFWRGVDDPKYVDSFKYYGDFVGGHYTYTGTWMAADREKALGYSDRSSPETLMEMMVNKFASIADNDDIKNIANNFRDALNQASNDNLDSKEYDKYLSYCLKYIMEMLASNYTWICVVSGYHGVNLEFGKHQPKREGDPQVVVIFDRSKIIMRNR